MKNNKWLIAGGVILLVLTLVGVSFAFFSPIIKGNEDAGENKVIAGTIELTFKENETDEINLENARPGSSASKRFTVENTGTLENEYTYNIKLTALNTTFKEQDLKYTLEEYTNDTYQTKKDGGLDVSGFINKDIVINKDDEGIGEMYLAVGINRPDNTQKHYYKLTITFENLEEINQNYNQGAIFSGKINVDDNANAKVYIPSKPFSEVIVADNSTIFADEAGNIRYAGADPANYVWFNCDDYNGITQENAVSEKHCEKWRIIGVMKNVEKEDGSQEDLIKIVRADSIGNYSWDNKNNATGSKSNNGENDWATAELMYLLNPNYSDHKLNNVLANNSLYWNSGSGNCSNDQNNTTTNCDFTNTGLKGEDNGPTKSMIESVKWYLGGIPNYETETTRGYYSAERGTTTYTGRPTTWTGKVGLIYPSDYGFATTGGNTGREACLAKETLNWSNGQWKTDCANNSWLKPSSGYIWTITPYSIQPSIVVVVISDGCIGSGDYGFVPPAHGVRPSLYLSSKVKIVGEGGNGSENNPYILTIEQ